MTLFSRTKQFSRAITANVSREEMQFAEGILSAAEQTLFAQLPHHEQKHAIETAKTIESLLTALPLDHPVTDRFQEQALLKAALLHDIGKIKSPFSPVEKALLVLFKHFFPSIYQMFVRRGMLPRASFFYQRFYLHCYHTVIGAELLKEIGSEAGVITLLTYYDQPKEKMKELPPKEQFALSLLKEADDLN